MSTAATSLAFRPENRDPLAILAGPTLLPSLQEQSQTPRPVQQAPDIHSYGPHAQAGQPASVEPELIPVAGDAEPIGASHGESRPVRRPQVPYLPVKAKFATAFCLSLAWTAFSTMMALPWMHDLAGLAGWPLSIFIVAGIALLPGMMNAFLVAGLLLDRRPRLAPLIEYPGISILVAAYNEQASIADTLTSLAQQQYPGEFEVIVIDDGSKDATAAIVEDNPYPWLRLLRQPRNMGKAAALNRGLAESRHDYVITLDADSYLYGDALQRLVERYFNDPATTGRGRHHARAQFAEELGHARAGVGLLPRHRGHQACPVAVPGHDGRAGRVLDVRPGRAAGHRRLEGLRRRGHRPDLGHAGARLARRSRRGRLLLHERARQRSCSSIRQRKRWSRGMIEAFRQHPRILVAPRMSTLFAWWNLLFPWLDLAYTLFFIPGVILALFGIYWIAGPMTLVLLPMGAADELRDVPHRRAHVRRRRACRCAATRRASCSTRSSTA